MCLLGIPGYDSIFLHGTCGTTALSVYVCMYDISSYSVFMSYSAKIVVCVECLWHACLRGALFCCLVNDKCEPWP